MRALFRNTPKLLVPVNGKTVLRRQLDVIPQEWSIILSLGPQSEQVDQYIRKFFPDRRISQVVESDPLKMSKGPAQSLLSCRYLLCEPFWLLFSDTLWTSSWPEAQHNTMFVGQYRAQSPKRFCNVETDQQQNVLALHDKVEVTPSPQMRPFIGLAYIEDVDPFFQALEQDQAVEDHQLTRGFETLVLKGLKAKPMDDWLDVGTPDSHQLTEQILKSIEL